MVRRPLADEIRALASSIETEGDRKPNKFRKTPKIKHTREQPSIKNKSNAEDYSQKYMERYRKEEGKDYQKAPDKVKELRRKQQESLKKKFDL